MVLPGTRAAFVGPFGNGHAGAPSIPGYSPSTESPSAPRGLASYYE